MENCARLYHCARCHCQVVICRHCDRGNIYCTQGCAQLARSESQRAAGQRYQSSLPGRHQHADRQRRYRQRVNDKVTHQGSPPDSANALLRTELNRCRDSVIWQPRPPGTVIQCHWCGRICSPFVRLTVLRGRYPPPASSQSPAASSQS